MFVRLSKDVIMEIIPTYALPVEKWYGEDFAKQCVEVNYEVECGWKLNPQTSKFEPYIPTNISNPTPDEDRDAMLVDLELRMTMLEMGVI